MLKDKETPERTDRRHCSCFYFCRILIARPWPPWSQVCFSVKSNITSSFHITQLISNKAEKMLEGVELKERARVLSASKAIENFALEYAENNLNDSEMITVTKDKLGKLLDWLCYTTYLIMSGS